MWRNLDSIICGCSHASLDRVTWDFEYEIFFWMCKIFLWILTEIEKYWRRMTIAAWLDDYIISSAKWRVTSINFKSDKNQVFLDTCVKMAWMKTCLCCSLLTGIFLLKKSLTGWVEKSLIRKVDQIKEFRQDRLTMHVLNIGFFLHFIIYWVDLYWIIS